MAASDSTPRRPGERQWLADAFGRALRDLVSEREMDYATLADRSGIRQPALDRLCAGIRLPDLDTLFVIARALDLTPEALIARTAIAIELKGYEHDVAVVFRRAPRMFRLVGSGGRETGDPFNSWFDVVAAAMKAPETYSAIAIYCRIAFFQPG
jgi:transcriptional regulator with XRE-family HTH domain